MPYTDFGASPYAYCAGDPINLVDPDRRKFFLFHIVWVLLSRKVWLII